MTKRTDITHGGHGETGDIPDVVPLSDVDDELTDWTLVQALSAEEVYRAALDDPDAQPMSPEQLSRMRRAPNVRGIRRQFGGMSQERFARLFQIPLGTLRDWEQGVHLPDSTSKAFLRVIQHDPLAVARALNRQMPVSEILRNLGAMPEVEQAPRPEPGVAALKTTYVRLPGAGSPPDEGIPRIRLSGTNNMQLVTVPNDRAA